MPGVPAAGVQGLGDSRSDGQTRHSRTLLVDHLGEIPLGQGAAGTKDVTTYECWCLDNTGEAGVWRAGIQGGWGGGVCDYRDHLQRGPGACGGLWPLTEGGCGGCLPEKFP